ALAGLVAAAGPVLIHLLNRRRFKVVPWAAMDFLQEAIVHSRRILQLRDLLLLAIRTLCIVAFGAALAQPFFSGFVSTGSDARPVHAVLLMDNSLSMGYAIGRKVEQGEEQDITLLDEAKDQAADVVRQLPAGSRISILPTCGQRSRDGATGYNIDAYYGKDDALAALATIRPVDQAALAHETIDRALRACNRVPDPADKKIVLFTDRQVADWPVESLAVHLKELPGPVQVVRIEPDDVVENAWISKFEIRDGITDLQTPAVFLATINYEGPEPKRGVEVSLTINGEPFASPTVDLQPGQQLEIEFPPYLFRATQFDALENPDLSKGRIALATARISIAAGDGNPLDGLAADDERFVVVPVAATLPVVFIDQLGENENPRLELYGETIRLRRLLAPKMGRAGRAHQLIEIKRRQITQVDRSLLEDARLVVIGGVRSPDSEATVALLRAYVEQGGNLVITAGGQFDPIAWNDAAWLDGLGILPAPLGPELIGRLPTGGGADDAPELESFRLDYDSMKNHDYFRLENSSDEELRELYRQPFFFKTVEALDNDQSRRLMVETTANHLQQRQTELADIDSRLAQLRDLETQQKLTADGRDERTELETRRSTLKPDWLLWSDPAQAEDDNVQEGTVAAEQRAERTKFSVLARYSNGLPFMVERRIGRGKVLLVTTGVFPRWNTLPLVNTVLIYDRIFRAMLQETLPRRNMSSQGSFIVPVSAAARNARITLSGPDHPAEPLVVQAVGANRHGITIESITRRGLYLISADRTEESLGQGLESRLWTLPLAVNGPAEESQLLSAEEIRRRAAQRGLDGGRSDGFADQASALSLDDFQSARVRGGKLWKWVIGLVLACLLLELVVLSSKNGARPMSNEQ
ncbi:MAG: BatA domain-containing protein, partial [Thermoguttaceae bacterium]